MELRQMNEEASSNREGFRSSEAFQRQYATVVLQLKEVNKQVLQSFFLLLFDNTFLGHLDCVGCKFFIFNLKSGLLVVLFNH